MIGSLEVWQRGAIPRLALRRPARTAASVTTGSRVVRHGHTRPCPIRALRGNISRRAATQSAKIGEPTVATHVYESPTYTREKRSHSYLLDVARVGASIDWDG